MEVHHGYVQWLFPNFYGSSFNSDASKLTREEAKIFRENREVRKKLISNFKKVAEKLVKSYGLILGFFGIELANKKTGKLERARKYEKR